MKKLDEDQLQPEVIDLGAARRGEINESWLAMFGGWVEKILGSMFQGGSIPAQIKGTRREVESFGNVLNGEKRYMTSFKKYGLDNPRTYKNKAKLQSAVKDFERTTKLKWPFK